MCKILSIALSQYGITEIVGVNNNPIVVNYFKEIGHSWVKDDETAWCSAFANWVALKANAITSNKLNARSWLNVGIEVKKPQQGDVVVFWRESKTSWKGHVAFYVNESENFINVIGGNQSNSVNIQAYAKEKLIGYRRITK
jgi:uncharacterized protein (TIGR02594 family)